MSLTLEHFSHPKHPLVLKECDVIADDARCYVCNTSVIASPTYTCSLSSVECQGFYLHKTCAELPTTIRFHKHNQHPLVLLKHPDDSSCDACGEDVKFSYTCQDCQFDVCLICAFQQRVLQHEGHPEHILTLMPRKSLFKCDACSEKAEDSSFVCITCDLCIHKECALSPFTIPAPAFHHHPLHLIYSVPTIHRYFNRNCNICQRRVHTNFWLYYCHKCTYFVHMRCATSSPTSAESLFDLIISQCCKLQVESQGKEENTIPISTAPDPPIINQHWSHKDHPLVQFQFSTSENDKIENNYDRRELICDGCIQPITISHPSYYACIQCRFFLHSFCATKLPVSLLAGVCPPHPHHSLRLHHNNTFYTFVVCEVCCFDTNGFHYLCETCDITIDIRCAFLPTKIKHKSHKHHSLILRPSSKFKCSASGFNFEGVPVPHYGCETCSNFHIDIASAFYPGRMKHRYDDHPVTLRLPPFFYEGVFYCETCEDQVNNQRWLYHCDECDHSFHNHCLLWGGSVKLERNIELDINDQSTHTYLGGEDSYKKDPSRVQL
ncbi:hypothetical protein DCAR_0313328 [Daucus carota subsp. sativus]|uniref:DC1 domain-containing protein n=1 Tax=Daucus carota subsp. sativus TaxID=79200 RepID=A0AAF1AUW6_DAUCS|nr:hypothetical protein DCAR_0313328 [Daucus carota subsp. sativus]